jgi:hypothetical protein
MALQRHNADRDGDHGCDGCRSDGQRRARRAYCPRGGRALARAEDQAVRFVVPPPQIRQLRDLTRYRAGLVTARTAEKQRAEKLLEDAGIKLSAVVTAIFGVSGRDMLAAPGNAARRC